MHITYYCILSKPFKLFYKEKLCTLFVYLHTILLFLTLQ
ncbi:unnamed protein product [Spodoptera exigua]|nr:unnamed protein product [Spodoptera exigua]